MFVNGAGAQRRPNVVADEFFAQVFHVSGGGAGGEGFFSRAFEIFLLADVADHGDDFALIIFLEPGNDDGSVEPAGVGEDYFLGFIRLYFHNSSLVLFVLRVSVVKAAASPPHSKVRTTCEGWP